MLGRGRYAQHQQLKSEIDEEDSVDDADVDSFHNVIYIGQEFIPKFSETNYNILIEKIYGQSFSPLAALTQSKKLELCVEHDGISLYNPPVKGSTRVVCTSYKIPDLVYLSSTMRHPKVLAVVCITPSKTATLSVFVCADEDEPGYIMNECKEGFSKNTKIQNFNTSHAPASLKIVYGSQPSEIPSQLQLNYPSENALNSDFGDFGEFQTALDVPDDAVKKTSPEKRLMDADDEFSQLALKRNIYLPDHLQDKTIESACLMQQQKQYPQQQQQHSQQQQKQQQHQRTMQNQRRHEPIPTLLSPTLEDCEENGGKKSFFKQGLFSSYSRVSTG